MYVYDLTYTTSPLGSVSSGSVTSLGSTGNGSPSDQDLMNKIAVVIPTKWRHVGLQLGLDQAQLDLIEQKHLYSRDSLACFGEVFMEWRKRMTSDFSWSTIITALKSPLVGENMLAHKLQMELDARYANCDNIIHTCSTDPFSKWWYWRRGGGGGRGG